MQEQPKVLLCQAAVRDEDLWETRAHMKVSGNSSIDYLQVHTIWVPF